MPRLSPVQTNFTQGELSPRLLGRQELDAGLSTLENMVVQPHGGATRRPGTLFVAEAKNSADFARLIPFEFSVTDTYVLELGDQYMRFYTNGGQVLSGGAPYEITTPWAHTDLFNLQHVQKDDIMYLAHESYPLQKLTRLSSTSWTLAPVETQDGPWLDQNTDTTWTITPSATTGNITLTASKATWTANHVGAKWRLKHGSTWGYVEITAFTSSTSVSATVKSTLGGTTATSVWMEGAWSAEQGYPRTLAFFEQRLWAGGTLKEPQRVWASVSADFDNFTPGTLDTDGLSYKLASTRSNAIQWMAPGRTLVIGTQGAEYIVGEAGAPITPSNIRVIPQTTYGSEHIQPVRASNVTLFVQRGGRKIRELSYQFENDSYVAPDLTIAAEHVTLGGLIELDYQQQPDQVVWAIRADGTLVGMTYEREQKVVAFHRHQTKGSFESVAVIHRSASSGEGYDEAWVLVKRTVGGATKRFVERMAPPFLDSTKVADSVFCDSALQGSDATPKTVWGGLTHLVGETVQVLADGAAHPDVVVDGSGQITLQNPASKVTAGLGYTPKLVTRPWWMTVLDGTTQGKRKRWARLKARVYRTLGARINGELVELRKASDPMDQPVPEYTGAIQVVNLGWDEEARVTIDSTQPMPLTVLSIFGVFELGGQ